MAKPIWIGKFTLLFLGYAVISFVAYLGLAFTSQAWIIYFLSLLPFYAICAIILILLTLVRPKNRRRYVRCRPLLTLPVILLQGLVILASPASCYGWSEGLACYSFIQAQLDEIKPTLDASLNPPHWHGIESAFPILLLLYLASILLFLVMCRLENRSLI